MQNPFENLGARDDVPGEPPVAFFQRDLKHRPDAPAWIRCDMVGRVLGAELESFGEHAVAAPEPEHPAAARPVYEGIEPSACSRIPCQQLMQTARIRFALHTTVKWAPPLTRSTKRKTQTQNHPAHT